MRALNWYPIALSTCLCLGVAACAPSRSMQPDASMDTAARLRVAQAAELGGDRQLAFSMYMSAADSKPNDVALQVRCAEALVRAGQIDLAKALLERRVQAAPHAVELRRALALIEVVVGQPGEALQLLETVLAANPHDLRALVAKGVALDMRQQHTQARQAYRQALALAPGDTAIINNLGLSLMLDGRVQQAETGPEPAVPCRGSSRSGENDPRNPLRHDRRSGAFAAGHRRQGADAGSDADRRGDPAGNGPFP